MALATSCNDGTVLDSVRLKPRSQGSNVRGSEYYEQRLSSLSLNQGGEYELD